MAKSQFDFSASILSNAQKKWKDPICIRISEVIYTKTSLDEELIAKYMKMNTCPPPILVMQIQKWYKIVDGHHRVESQKRKWFTEISVYLAW